MKAKHESNEAVKYGIACRYLNFYKLACAVSVQTLNVSFSLNSELTASRPTIYIKESAPMKE